MKQVIIKAIDIFGGAAFQSKFDNPQNFNHIYNLCKVYKGFANIKEVIITEIKDNQIIINKFED